MAKSRRSDVSPREQKPSPLIDQQAYPPNPPRKRPWFLAISAFAVAAWLLFLLWMAIESHR